MGLVGRVCVALALVAACPIGVMGDASGLSSKLNQLAGDIMGRWLCLCLQPPMPSPCHHPGQRGACACARLSLLLALRSRPDSQTLHKINAPLPRHTLTHLRLCVSRDGRRDAVPGADQRGYDRDVRGSEVRSLHLWSGVRGRWSRDTPRSIGCYLSPVPVAESAAAAAVAAAAQPCKAPPPFTTTGAAAALRRHDALRPAFGLAFSWRSLLCARICLN